MRFQQHRSISQWTGKILQVTKPALFTGLALLSLAVVTGCHSTQTTSEPAYAPSGGGEAVAEERPGAGVGAQTGMGAAASVPESTEQGAGASNLAPKPETQLPGEASGNATITDATKLTSSPEPTNLAGREVMLSGLQVQQVIGNELLVTRSAGSNPLYVQLPAPQPTVQPGDTVAVTGSVQRVPGNPADLGLNPQASQALEGQPIYIEAEQVQVTNR